MRNLIELNINKRGKPVQLSAPNNDILTEFGKYCGFPLPDHYLQLLNYSNGGHPELDSILPQTQTNAGRWAVNIFYHLNEDKTSDTSLWKALEVWRPILGKLSLPFANDGGGNQFYLDLTRDPPAVMICIHDENFRVFDIAHSFESFIEGLEIDDDMI